MLERIGEIRGVQQTIIDTARVVGSGSLCVTAHRCFVHRLSFMQTANYRLANMEAAAVYAR
jgi:hypothetical protein